MQMKHYSRPGFGLMEAMIYIAIMGILAATVGPALMTYYRNAQKRAVRSTINGFKSAINLYQVHVGQYPTTLKDLIKRPRDERISKKWDGPYIDKQEIPEDSWGESYKYKVTSGGKHPYELHSFGPSGPGAPKEEWISVWDE